MPCQQGRLRVSHPCLWVGHSPHVTRLSYLWNHYLFICPSILFKLGLMELGTDKSGAVPVGAACEDVPRGATWARGAVVVTCPHGVTASPSPWHCHSAVPTGQDTCHSYFAGSSDVWTSHNPQHNHPVIRATSPWSTGMGGGSALLPPLITSGDGCTSGLTLTALGEGANTSSRPGKLGNPVYGSGIDPGDADYSPP